MTPHSLHFRISLVVLTVEQMVHVHWMVAGDVGVDDVDVWVEDADSSSVILGLVVKKPA